MNRTLVWIEQQHFLGFGCSECGWRFEPSDPTTDTSFDEMMHSFELQRDKEFTSHVCADHSKGAGFLGTHRYTHRNISNRDACR
jgi:rubredoxin